MDKVQLGLGEAHSLCCDELEVEACREIVMQATLCALVDKSFLSDIVLICTISY